MRQVLAFIITIVASYVLFGVTPGGFDIFSIYRDWKLILAMGVLYTISDFGLRALGVGTSLKTPSSTE